MNTIISLIAFASLLLYSCQGFTVHSVQNNSINSQRKEEQRTNLQRRHVKSEDSDVEEEKKGFFNSFFGNLNDVAEDFFYKRMGKGEIFYGKRMYKPSGDVEGDYNGMGLSDKQKIDMTREYKEAMMEEKQFRDELRKIRDEKAARDASRYS